MPPDLRLCTEVQQILVPGGAGWLEPGTSQAPKLCVTLYVHCRRRGSQTNWGSLYQRNATLLRYTRASVKVQPSQQLLPAAAQPQASALPFIRLHDQRNLARAGPLAGQPEWQTVAVTGALPCRCACHASPFCSFPDFVEIMAPMVSAELLVQLRTLLEDSYTGEWAGGLGVHQPTNQPTNQHTVQAAVH
jgi:hypothetical protein